MEDKNFDKSLKDIFENPPEFSPDAHAIADMERRLDDSDQRKRRGVLWPWWIIPLSVLPFLLTTIYFFTKYKNANGQNLHLTQYQIDTIINRHIIYHYDTIYTAVYLQTTNSSQPITTLPGSGVGRIKNSPSSSSFQHQPRIGSAFYPSLPSTPNERLWSDYSNLLSASFFKEQENDDRKVDLSEQVPFSILNHLTGLAFKPLGMPERNAAIDLADLSQPIALEQKRKVNPLLHLIPTGFSLGVQASPVGFGNFPGNIYSYGLHGAIHFAQNVQLNVGLEKLDINFEVKSAEYIERFPILSPDDPADQLKEVKGTLPYLQIPIGIQYSFRPDKKLNPYFGLGIIARRALAPNLKYEFIGPSGEYYRDNNLSGNPDFYLQNIQATLGFQYPLWKALYLNASGFYSYNLEMPEGAFFQLRYLGIQLGMDYKF